MPGPFSGLLFYCAAKHHSPAEKQPPLIDPDLSQHATCGIKRMKMHLQKTPSVEFYRAVSLSRPAFAPAEGRIADAPLYLHRSFLWPSDL
jgi:hypothetical protein